MVYVYLDTWGQEKNSNYSTIWRIARRGSFLSAMDQVFVSPQNSYVEILTPNVMVLGGEAFGR